MSAFIRQSQPQQRRSGLAAERSSSHVFVPNNKVHSSLLHSQRTLGNKTVQRLPQPDANMRASEQGKAPPIVEDVLRSPGQSLDQFTQGHVQGYFGRDFSQVRVHADEQAAKSAALIHAKAYTTGNHIVFGANRYQPQSSEGRRLLAHELTHVVQQAGTVASPGGLRIGAPDGALEAEAAAVAIGGSQPMLGGVRMAAGIIQRDVLPVARFSPAPGLILERTEKSVTISGKMELYGPEANAARAASIQNSINTTWTHTFPDGYSVTCNITVTYRGPGSTAGSATQIEADKLAGPSHVSPGLGGRTMTLNANEATAFTWTSAHEFGHIIGLNDHYSESIISKVKGRLGGKRTTTIQSGYGGNIMAVSGGALESKNIRDIAEENEPSPYWINDDDQVRDWITGHSPSAIGKLSTPNKLKAIKTLMGGWISDADVTAIARICSSVTTKTEADAIRDGVDLLDFSSLGQRTRVRVAFVQMP